MDLQFPSWGFNSWVPYATRPHGPFQPSSNFREYLPDKRARFYRDNRPSDAITVQEGHGSSAVAACNANRRDGAGPVRGKGFSGSSSLKSVWVPIKSRGNTSSVACGDDSSIVPGLKIGGITIDKPELAASTISGLKIAAARLRFGSVQTSEISGDGIQQQQRQPGACHSQGIATEKGNLRLEVDQQKYLKEASSGLRTESASSSTGLVMKRSSAGASKSVTEQPGISLAEGNIFTSKIAGYQHKLGNLVGNRIKSVAPGTKPKPQWCPAGLTHTQKQRVQWLWALEIKEEQANIEASV